MFPAQFHHHPGMPQKTRQQGNFLANPRSKSHVPTERNLLHGIATSAATRSRRQQSTPANFVPAEIKQGFAALLAKIIK